MRLLLTLLLTTTLASAQKVHTEAGTVEGVATPDTQVLAYKGIPYAAPPSGNLRWAPPQPAAPWHGTLIAKDFGHHCIQFGTNADMVFLDPGPSEDCLNLNVWAPAHAKPGSLPVMVWIFGGGFTTGATSEPRQDGQFLANHHVVVVSMNYRLGMLGYFTSPELTQQSPHHASGNYGLMDQAAAIAWVARNIRAFGGDPKIITLFGESAGSFSVSAQMASPLSKALIAKGIGESGGAFHSSGLPYPGLAKTEQDDAAFAQSAFNAATIADLRKISADDLVKAAGAHTTPPPPHFGPVVDGYFLPQSVPEIYAAGNQAHVPLLAGWNADEVRSMISMNPVKPTVDTFSAQATKDFGTNSQQFLAAYPATTDAEAVQSAGDFVSDRFIAYSTWAWLEAQVNTGQAPGYRYRFDLAAPGDKFHPAGIGAFHSDDIEYVFGTLDSRLQATIRPEDRTLSDQIQQYWTNFARNGNPNGVPDGRSLPVGVQNAPNLPTWPTYGPTNDWQVMHLNVPSEAKPDTQRNRYLFLDSVWSKPSAP